MKKKYLSRTVCGLMKDFSCNCCPSPRRTKSRMFKNNKIDYRVPGWSPTKMADPRKKKKALPLKFYKNWKNKFVLRNLHFWSKIRNYWIKISIFLKEQSNKDNPFFVIGVKKPGGLYNSIEGFDRDLFARSLAPAILFDIL